MQQLDDSAISRQTPSTTPEDVAWCCQFIVTNSLRLTAAEAQLNNPYQRVRMWKAITERLAPGAEVTWMEY
ncbi:hypothetical protein [Herbidospora sp. RD11066]